MKVDWIKEKDNLIILLNNNKSYESIGRIYGVTGASVKKAAKKLGIVLVPKRKINPNETFNKGSKRIEYCINCGKELTGNRNNKKYCSVKCQCEYKNKEYINNWLNGNIDGIVGKYGISQHIRGYLFKKNNNKCQICGWGEVNPHTGNVPLEVHHIDGDYTNNSEENLQLLCPNCHSLTETYKNSNKNGRKSRNKYK